MRHERSTLPTPISSNSFWHSEPNEFLFGHRTTAELPSEADIVIVGSGITGSSAARFLAEDERAKGKSVVLLEAREACWGATGRVSQLYIPESHAVNQDEAIESSRSSF
jgi:hypothetical protein